MPLIITKDGQIASTSKENVRDHGEVFTPEHIVKSMMDLIPSEFIADPSAILLEPTCGTGNFLVEMYEYKRREGLPIEQTLNTIIGMELNKKTIVVAHRRLYELVVKDMKAEGITPQSKEWVNNAIKYVMIIRNNIFSVKDSLIVLADFAKDKGILAKKKFVFSDPTVYNEVMTTKQRNELKAKVKKAFNDHKIKKTETLAPFFGE